MEHVGTDSQHAHDDRLALLPMKIGSRSLVAGQRPFVDSAPLHINFYWSRPLLAPANEDGLIIDGFVVDRARLVAVCSTYSPRQTGDDPNLLTRSWVLWSFLYLSRHCLGSFRAPTLSRPVELASGDKFLEK